MNRLAHLLIFLNLFGHIKADIQLIIIIKQTKSIIQNILIFETIRKFKLCYFYVVGHRKISIIKMTSKKVTLISSPICPFSHRAWLTLLEKKVDF
jgi:hypothetical protein